MSIAFAKDAKVDHSIHVYIRSRTIILSRVILQVASRVYEIFIRSSKVAIFLGNSKYWMVEYYRLSSINLSRLNSGKFKAGLHPRLMSPIPGRECNAPMEATSHYMYMLFCPVYDVHRSEVCVEFPTSTGDLTLFTKGSPTILLPSL